MASWYPTELERHFTLLEALEREPKWKTTRQLKELLDDRKLSTSLRTVQRILEYFAERFGLCMRISEDKPGNPHEWAWAKRALTVPFPVMEPATALTYQLAAELLAPLLPAAFLDELRPEFKRAGKVLGQTSRGTQRLVGKLRVLPRGSGRLPARVHPRVLHVIEEALWNQRKVRVTGKLRGQSERTRAVVSPLALVFRFDTMYLVYVVEGRDRVSTSWVALHRLEWAGPTNDAAVRPAHFDLDLWVGNVQRHELPPGLCGVRTEPTRLRLRVLEGSAYDSLVERPFSSDQTITKSDGEWILEARVTITRDLLTELRDFGPTIEVLEPGALRSHFTGSARRLFEVYRDIDSAERRLA